MFTSGKQTANHNARAWNSKYAGKEAFTTTMANGYKQGRIMGKTYLAHRVVWCLTHGEWPDCDIDHINGIRDDNRIVNLRPVDRSDNMKNAARPKDNTSGTIGVSWCREKSKWKASIGSNGRSIYIGRYIDIEDAIIARRRAEIKYGFHANHGRSKQ